MRDTVGPYRLLEPLGEDRLGQRYRARDTAHGRTVLIRIVHQAIAADPASRERLLAAASAASAVSHPSVAALYEIIETPEEIALAHEHVEGRTLAATLGGQALNPRAAVAIAIQLADGLAELHAADLTHGALDSEHVMVTPRGQAKLVDAGVASFADLTNFDDDVASLGSLLREMTGSELPGETWAADLKTAIARTEARHARRYQSVALLAADLRRVSAVLEVRAVAATVVRTSAKGSGGALPWLIAGLLLLFIGVWLLMM